MAKKDKADKKSEKIDAKAEKATEREFKYGVEELAEELGIKPASVRVQLRNKGIEKAGKQYGWNSKSELKEVIDQLKAAAEDDEKPAKKSKKADKPAKADKKGKDKPAKKSKKAKDEDEDDDD